MNSLNVTKEMQLLGIFIFITALHVLAHHQELTKTVSAAYSDGMR
jgi:hypothetical protein